MLFLKMKVKRIKSRFDAFLQAEDYNPWGKYDHT